MRNVLIVWLFAMWLYPTHSNNRYIECDMKININLNDIVSTIFSLTHMIDKHK